MKKPQVQEIVEMVTQLVELAELAELGRCLGNDGHQEAVQRACEELEAMGACSKQVAMLADVGRRAGAFLATIDVTEPQRNPAEALVKLGERHVRKETMRERVDGILADFDR